MILGLGGAATLFLLDQILPYGATHIRDISAVHLRGRLGAWKKSSNDEAEFEAGLAELVGSDPRHLSLTSMDFTNRGQRFHAAIRSDDPRFEAKGFLVGTTNCDVFWISRDGATELLWPKPKAH